MHLKTPDGQSAVVAGGSVPAVHDGWMWDLTVPGNNDHDFYVGSFSTAVLVHNEDCEVDADRIASHVVPRHTPGGSLSNGRSILGANEDLPSLARGSDGQIGSYQAGTSRI
jgi:hypothetical protein